MRPSACIDFNDSRLGSLPHFGKKIAFACQTSQFFFLETRLSIDSGVVTPDVLDSLARTVPTQSEFAERDTCHRQRSESMQKGATQQAGVKSNSFSSVRASETRLHKDPSFSKIAALRRTGKFQQTSASQTKNAKIFALTVFFSNCVVTAVLLRVKTKRASSCVDCPPLTLQPAPLV